MLPTLLLFGGFGAVISLLVISFVLRYPELVGHRSQFHHGQKVEKSRLGGVGIAAAFVVLSIAAAAFFQFPSAEKHTGSVVICSSLAMFLLGFWDDIKPLGAKVKLLAQVVIALFAWSGGIQISTFKNPYTNDVYQLHELGCGLTVFWLITLPNLINLIDGIDGLAGGISLMLMALLAYVGAAGAGYFPALCAAGMIGAIIGFLRFNFPPARIYLGDGGAYFLGFLVAVLAIINSHKGTIVAGLLAPLFVLALPILDVALAICRRGLKGLPIFRPDRRHIHHKLLHIGYSPRKAVLTLYFVTLVLLAVGVAAFWSNGRWAPVLFGFVCLAFILSARSFSFSREWFAVGRILGNSIEMRETIHYALTMAKWFELESKNCDSIENLWSDFQFLLIKLNFHRADLVLSDGIIRWQRDNGQDRIIPLPSNYHEFSFGDNYSVKLVIEKGETASVVFEHVADIAAEAWHKGMTGWCKRHGVALSISSRIERRPSQRATRRYVPLCWSQSAARPDFEAGSRLNGSMPPFADNATENPGLQESPPSSIAAR